MTSTKIFQLEYGTGPGGEDAGDDDQRGERQPGAAPRHVSSRGRVWKMVRVYKLFEAGGLVSSNDKY